MKLRHPDCLRANVEVTGAARLYRAASVWTAGLELGDKIELLFQFFETENAHFNWE